jgi:hypothetical protein
MAANVRPPGAVVTPGYSPAARAGVAGPGTAVVDHPSGQGASNRPRVSTLISRQPRRLVLDILANTRRP